MPKVSFTTKNGKKVTFTDTGKRARARRAKHPPNKVARFVMRNIGDELASGKSAPAAMKAVMKRYNKGAGSGNKSGSKSGNKAKAKLPAGWDVQLWADNLVVALKNGQKFAQKRADGHWVGMKGPGYTLPPRSVMVAGGALLAGRWPMSW